MGLMGLHDSCSSWHLSICRSLRPLPSLRSFFASSAFLRGTTYRVFRLYEPLLNHARENTETNKISNRGFINIFSRWATVFYRQAKPSSRWSKQAGKLILTAAKFAWFPTLVFLYSDWLSFLWHGIHVNNYRGCSPWTPKWEDRVVFIVGSPNGTASHGMSLKYSLKLSSVRSELTKMISKGLPWSFILL